MREGEFEYIHEFKERINEILFLQKKHHEIVENNSTSPQIQQISLAELHRLSITLSNLFDALTHQLSLMAPLPYQLHQKIRSSQQQTASSSSLSVLRGLEFWIWDEEIHRQQALSSNSTCCFNHVVGPRKTKRPFHCLIMKRFSMMS